MHYEIKNDALCNNKGGIQMKAIRKIVPLVISTMMLVVITGCGGKEENMNNKKSHEKNPIATMQVEYENAQGEKKEGTIKFELYASKAPETVNNFVNLINNNFYNGLTFHRIIKDFMIQGGDPKGDGTGSAKVSDINKSVQKDSEEDYPYTINGEFKANNFDNDIKYEAGTLAMARGDYSRLGCAEEGYNSGCSQFFIVNTDKASIINSLQDNYTAFGKVIEGYDVVLDISNVKVVKNGSETSKPEKAPVIKSFTVDTFGEQYDLPKMINDNETKKTVQQKYVELIQQYYKNSQNDAGHTGN
jgi:peptidyl-prolyl cis-trans isomerase B (cyclophilin B)